MTGFGNVKSVRLDNSEYFAILGGLWKGKKPPFIRAGVIRNTNFTPSGEIDYSDVAWLDVEARQLAKRQLRQGDIIIERSGGGPKQPVGRVVQFRRSDGMFSFSNFTTAVRVKRLTELDPLFAFYVLLELYQSGRTDDIQRRTTGLRNLDFKAYKERADFPLIPLPEQRRIAHVLTTVQTAIEQQARLIALTRELKSALMRKLFTEGLRGEKQKETEIGSVPESWAIQSLKDNAQVKGGKRLPKGHKLVAERTDYPYLRVTDFENHSVNTTGLRYLLPETQVHIKRYIITDKDVFISIAGTIGVVGMIPPELDGANLTENAARIVVQNKRISPRFLMYFLSTDGAQREIHAQTVKNAQPKLALVRIGSLRIPIPELDEQEEIVQALDVLRQKAILLQQKRNLLEELFRALLHQLMTGQIRLSDLDLPGFS